MTENELLQAIAAIKAKDFVLGQSLLTNVIKQQPENETAWVWSAAIQTSDQKKIYCLEKALQINPSNQKAKQALEKLTTVDQPSVEAITGKVQNVESQSISQTITPVSPTNHTNNRWLLIVGGAILIIGIIVAIVLFSLSNFATPKALALPTPTKNLPTSVPTPDLAIIDMASFSIIPSDLTFGGLQKADDWVECPGNEAGKGYSATSSDRQYSRSYSVGSCDMDHTGFLSVTEEMYITMDEREAQRIAEEAKNRFIAIAKLVMGRLPEQTVLSLGDYPDGLIIQDSTNHQTHWVIFQVDHVVILISFYSDKTLVVADLADVTTAAINYLGISKREN